MMRKSVFGFFMLFVFYLVLGYLYLNIGIEFLIFTPFYVFFILILSFIPTLLVTSKNVLGDERRNDVLLVVNIVHIVLVVMLIVYDTLHNYFLGDISLNTEYIVFGVSLLVNILVLFGDIKEKWVITALVIYTLAFVLFYYIGVLIFPYFPLLYPFTLLYLLLHNVTIVSYGLLKTRY